MDSVSNDKQSTQANVPLLYEDKESNLEKYNFHNKDGYEDAEEEKKGFLESIFFQCLYLGVISFGGPIAHLGLINEIFIKEKHYVTEKNFPQLFAICNVVPGPTSSQLIAAIGTIKNKSVFKGLLSFLLFNLPSLTFIILFAWLSEYLQSETQFVNTQSKYYMSVFCVGVSQGAVAIVFHSALNLTKEAETNFQKLIVIGAGVLYLFFRNYGATIILMTIGGLLTIWRKEEITDHSAENFVPSLPFLGVPSLLTFLFLFFILFIINYLTNYSVINFYLMFTFYKIGSFTEEQAIFPILENEFVKNGLISENEVINSFSLVSLLPGPVFNIAGYIGTVINGIPSGFISAYSLFLPGLLLIFASLSLFSHISENPKIPLFLRGFGSAAIGFIFTAGALLWYQSCFNNIHFSVLIGSLNVMTCYLLLDRLRIKLFFVILFGGMFSIIMIII